MTEQLPIELECFLMTWGFNERDRPIGAKRHVPVAIKSDEEDPRAVRGWTPSFEGEEPPF